MARILVIDDERSIRSALREILEYEKFEVDEAADGPEGIQLFRERAYDVVLCDIKMPRMDGIEVLKNLLEGTAVPVIMISGHGTIDTAVEAIKRGAYDYISKPLDLNRLLIALKNAIERKSLVEETRLLRKRLAAGDEMVGESAAILQVKNMIGRVAPTEARVLITGQSGTGKELVARQIHALSRRSSGPFIEVNCAAIPAELIESKLFGHEKGSFTSAVKQHKGDFEQASGGTLFLDEIGDMSLAAQAKVLRALQENRITRVGGDRDVAVDVRIVAATNKNLLHEIENKTFRDDLYHRLSVILIEVPPLSARIDDIPLLAEHFLSEFSASMGKPGIGFSGSGMEALARHTWPGNIRQLRNVVERLVILCDGLINSEEVEKYA